MRQSKKPILSVIMPVYNGELFLDKAISSILNQSMTDFELLISDDKSTDNSKKIIDSFKEKDIRISAFHNEVNNGKVQTVNALFKRTKGKFVTIHDADDWSHKDRFEKQIDFLDFHKKIGFCGTNFFTIGKVTTEKSDLMTKPEDLKKGLVDQAQMHGPTIVFRKKLVNKVYRSFFNGYGEDYDLTLRLLNKSEAANLKEPLYYYRVVKGSLSKKLSSRKLFLHDIARFLWKQREIDGADDLETGNEHKVEQVLECLMNDYINDKSLIHIKQAELNMYYGFYYDAIKESIRAIQKRPCCLRNYNTLQYTLRKTIFGN